MSKYTWAVLTAIPYAPALYYDTHDPWVWASLGLSLASLFVPNKVDGHGLIRLALLFLAAVYPALAGLTVQEALAYAFVLFASALYVTIYEYEELLGVGVFMGILYTAVVLLESGQLRYLVYPETLLGVAVTTHFVRKELNDWRDSGLFDRVLLALTLSVPFCASALSLFNLGLVWPGLAYFAALVALLVGHFFLKSRATPYFIAGVLAYFVPPLSSLIYPRAFEDAGNAWYLLLAGTLALLVYAFSLFVSDGSFVAIMASPFLIGLTVVLIELFVQPKYWFLAYAPWMPLVAAASYVFNNYTWTTTPQQSPVAPTPQQTTQPPVTQQSPPGPPQTAPSPAPAQPLVTFVVRGLPATATAAVSVGGLTCYGNYLIYCPTFGAWTAHPVTAGNVTYYPSPDSGYVHSGSRVVIDYFTVSPAQPQQSQPTQAPSQTRRRKRGAKAFDPDALVGETLGVYKVEELLGEGGFGYVYLATRGKRRFAIKILKIQEGRAEEYFQSLFQEASNLVNLSKHRNVVKIYAVDVDLNVIREALAGKYSNYYKQPPRIVMEYMAGGNLHRYLYDDTFFYSSTWERAVVRAVKSVAEALDFVHSNGFVHMDVKPQNVFLKREPVDPSELPRVTFKLGDLGSAVRVGKRATQLSTEYAPPEAFLEPAKPTTDVFALGITLYVLLTRRNDRPDLQAMEDAFDCYASGDVSCVKARVEEARKLLASWDPRVDEPYKSLIKAMTDPDPLKRPAAREVAEALRRRLNELRTQRIP
ncbi:MAG: serine/threonine-protein kinase [Thermoprotei archaeon]